MNLDATHPLAGRPVGRSALREGLFVVLAMALAGLPLLNNVGVMEVTSLVGVSGLASWVAWRHLSPSDPAASVGHGASASTQAQADALPTLLVDVLPVWQEHVTSVKTQVEDAITQLATSFASITGQFEAAGFKGANGAASEGVSTISLLTLCERELQPMIAAMTRILDSKDTLMSSVKDLAQVTTELETMASAVGQIAMKTNLLAINAAIEAAHAGDTGRGFAVIAKEIRQLSEVSAQTGQQITDRMSQVSTLMRSTVDVAEQAMQEDKQAIEMSTRVVDDVLSHVRELGVDADNMRDKGNVICADIENMLVNLQFQDRVSQIIGVVDGDIKRLQDVVVTDQPVPTPDDWISTLQQTYTMNEQHDVHLAKAQGTRASKTVPAPDEVMFF